ncbi:MAG: leucyl aminopeptidase family protein [Bacteroidales bacterium]|jgi:leucyl aminopeptidase|nr:leucyl aminopeptidase family protein [Bacteroidales bacterium]
MITIDKLLTPKNEYSNIILVDEKTSLNHNLLSQEQEVYINNQHRENKQNFFAFNNIHSWLIVAIFPIKKEEYKTMEELRKIGAKILDFLDTHHISHINLISKASKEETLSFVQGVVLSSYCFDDYKTDPQRLVHPFDHISIIHSDIEISDIEKLKIISTAVEKCKDLVNEPVCSLNATGLSEALTNLSLEAGIRVEVMHKKEIEHLKMGGLLAVNKGSVDEPTFTIMEYKPKGYKNKKPLLLVGKGIVYDTGGLNIKPGDYMEEMKTDMAGAAMMACAIYACALLSLPVHIIGLFPATDNRPNGNAYASGDIINMYDGTNVEVVNTDAEGRMILADALAFAKQYNPALIVDAATLTGAAQRAIGPFGCAVVQNNAEEFINNMKEAGNLTYERLAEFPFWEEYDQIIKSDIADIKNSGEKYAGMISAGKFLAHFTSDFPFIHLDIAGVAYFEKKQNYYGYGATGWGVRLMVEFIEKYFIQK